MAIPFTPRQVVDAQRLVPPTARPLHDPAGASALLGVFDRYGDDILRFCRAVLHNEADAEDVTQDTFLKLLALFKAGGTCSNVRAWLFAVAANGCRDRGRWYQRWQPWRDTHDGVAPAADADLDAAEREQSLRRAWGKLPSRDRTLLALRAEGFSYHDIGRIAGVRPVSVGRLLARALNRWSRQVAVAAGRRS